MRPSHVVLGYVSALFAAAWLTLWALPLEPVQATPLAPLPVVTTTSTLPTPTATPAYQLFAPVLGRVVPGAPGAFVLFATPRGERLTVSWNPSPGAQGYRVWVSAAPSMATAQMVYTAGDPATLQVDTDLLPLGTRYFQAEAFNAWGATRSRVIAVTSVRLDARADATVLERLPEENFGDALDMWAGYDTCYGVGVGRSLVSFDVAALRADVLVQQALLSVALVTACDTGHSQAPLTVRRADGAWSEMGVTWANKPMLTEGYGEVNVPSRAWGRYTVDITEMVQGWQFGSFRNHGLWLVGPEAGGDNAVRLGFGTREAGAPHVPFLLATFVQPLE